MVLGIGSRRLRSAGIVGLVVAAFVWLLVGPSNASAATITSGGPLTQIEVNEELDCQLVNGNEVQFDAGITDDGNYCATAVALNGDVYADTHADEVADFDFIPVGQSPVTGSGTTADPFKVTTVVEVVAPIEIDRAAELVPAQDGESALLTVSQTDTYVTGDDFFRTDITVTNPQDFAQNPVLYHAGDCTLRQSDDGYAVNDSATTGTVFCEPQNQLQTASTVPQIGNAPGILGFVPIGGGSHFYEALAGEGDGDLFQAIDGSDFPDLCDNCDLDPDDEEGPVDNGTGLSWALSLPAHGSATRCFLTVSSRTNQVPAIPSGCTPAASPPDTIAQKPSSCKLRISRARIFLFSRHPRMRLVARYRSSDPADVNIDYVAVQNGHNVPLGEVVKHFGKHGLFRLRKELTESQAETLRSTDRFIVHFKIPGEPGFCARQYTKHLTVPRIVEGQRVVFQEDSKFPQPGSGHPEGS